MSVRTSPRSINGAHEFSNLSFDFAALRFRFEQDVHLLRRESPVLREGGHHALTQLLQAALRLLGTDVTILSALRRGLNTSLEELLRRAGPGVPTSKVRAIKRSMVMASALNDEPTGDEFFLYDFCPHPNRRAGNSYARPVTGSMTQDG